MQKEVMQGILLPFLGTTLGAACVFTIQKTLHAALQRTLTGFAAGVMTAASVWSLLVPAMEQAAGMGKWAFFPAAAGFWLGILFLLVLDRAVPHLHQHSDEPEGPHSRLKRSTMLVLAVTLHNIPEGMAVGVVLAGWLAGNETITAAGALALAAGIAIQNFPEGAIISMPLSLRASLRCGGAPGGSPDPLGGGADPSGPALSAQLRGGGHDLCGGGGADSGGIRRRALQPRYAVLCRGIRADDGAGHGSRMSAAWNAGFFREPRCLPPWDLRAAPFRANGGRQFFAPGKTAPSKGSGSAFAGRSPLPPGCGRRISRFFNAVQCALAFSDRL